MLKRILRWPIMIAGAFAIPAAAHTVWLVPEKTGSSWLVQFGGHAGQTNTYPANKLKTVTAVGANGKHLRATRKARADGVHLTFSGQPSLIMAHYDNGIHTTRSNGPSVEMPMDKVPDALKATRAIKYHKTVATWSAIVTRKFGQPFEVVPLSASQPIAGEPMKVRVLIAGKPAAGIAIARNEEGREAVTDRNGMASFTPTRGFNKLWAGKRSQIKGNKAFTEESIEYSLGFFAR